MRDTTIVVPDGRIERFDPSIRQATYDLKSLTVLPGLIDTHVHIAWHFGADGRFAQRDRLPAEAMGYTPENAYVTLQSGFTTVQSVGNPVDKEARDAIARGVLPGPRVLTCLTATTRASRRWRRPCRSTWRCSSGRCR